MKIFKLFVLGIMLFFAGSTQAQLSVRFNIGTAPSWGPSGYSDVRYYYLPDVQAYYDVPSSMFIYYEGGSWVRRSYLPRQYRNYDLYNGYKVVLKDYRGNTPYTQFSQHKKIYARGYRSEPQRTIGERPGNNTKYNSKVQYQNNQSNRGRNVMNNNSRVNDDRNYDKQGKEKPKRNSRKN
jgi:hypothetical protein